MKEDKIKVLDIVLATYLVCKGFPVEYEVNESGLIDFYFPDNPSVKQEIEEYRSKRALVNPKQFYVNFKKIKTQMQYVKSVGKGSKNDS